MTVIWYIKYTILLFEISEHFDDDLSTWLGVTIVLRGIHGYLPIVSGTGVTQAAATGGQH